MKTFLTLTTISAVGGFTWSIGQRIDQEVIYLLVGAVFFAGLALPLLLLVFNFLSEQQREARAHREAMAKIEATWPQGVNFNILSLGGQQRTLGVSQNPQTWTVEGKVNRPALTANQRPQAQRG